jgi:hypothetical protein
MVGKVIADERAIIDEFAPPKADGAEAESGEETLKLQRANFVLDL